ncbi:MAG: hypothetical protein JNK02_09160 [Planctomycetes bacterium]|nr:hypothetical protein [Planctomycetota bacterium]
MRTTLRLVTISLLLASPALAQGDTGFLRGAGKTDYVLSWTQDSYDRFWVGEDKVSDPGVGEITREATALYVAYGLRDDMDLVLSGSYVSAESDGSGGIPSVNDFQDAIVGIKWRAWAARAGKSEFSALLAPALKMLITDYENNQPTAIGDGQGDLRARGILHWQHDSGFFASLESGYDMRDGLPHDEVPLNFTIGATFFNRLTVTPFYSQVFSQGGYDIGQGDFPGVKEEFERWGVGAYFRITDRFGVTALYRDTLDGRNTGDADSYGAGLVLKL